MLITIEDALPAPQVRELRARLESAGDAWVDGRATAGHQGAPVKRNQQIDEASSVAAESGALVLSALERHPEFISAALPNRVYPPMFNRYGVGMSFGPHVDGAVRLDPRTGDKLRTDVSGTLFLTPPQDYDGGELEIADTYGAHGVKLEAGALVLYPAGSLHQVTPVTRGERLACVFWVQSLVREDDRRALLYDMDGAIRRIASTSCDEIAHRTLIGCYHNLLRQWSEV